MTEQLAVDYHHKLPISIIRPSIVTCSMAEVSELCHLYSLLILTGSMDRIIV